MTDYANNMAIDEQLDSLQPTKKLLDFYRRKLSEYEVDHDKLFKCLKEFQVTYESQSKLEKDLQDRDEELATLRSALSDLQACLLHEREHVLRLYADNDRLKIRELEDRRKIEHLLCLCGKHFPNANLEDLCSSDLCSNAARTQPALKKRPLPKAKVKDTAKPTSECLLDKEVHPLTFQVEALRAQLEDQSRLARETILSLTEDCKLSREESKMQRLRDAGKINNLTNQLKCSQDLLHRMTRDHLISQQEHRRREQVWLAQRDRMALKAESLKRNLGKAPSSAGLQRSTSDQVESMNFDPFTVSERKATSQSSSAKAQLQNLQKEVEKNQRQSENFRTQCQRLEENNALLKEERNAAAKLYNDRCESLLSRLKLVSSRYTDLEKRFKLQMEGYRNDVKILKTQLQTLERQFLKAALRQTEEDADVLMLQQVQKSTLQSKLIYDNLKALKVEIYQLEQDLRHL